MANAIKALRRLQIGKEGTRGTPVAATRRLAVTDGEFQINQALEDHADEIQGTLARSSSPPTITKEGSQLNLTLPLDFDHILLPLLSGMKGGVTPTQPGGAGPAELWTFTPSVTTAPAPDTYTLEYSEHDGSGEESHESNYGICDQFGISAGEDGVSELTISMKARKATDTASTGALAVPTTLERIPSSLWKLYIDDTWANLGTTQITGQLYGLDIKWQDFLRLDRYHDGRASLDASNHEHVGGRMLEATLNLTVNPTSGAVVTERADKDASTKRFVRLEAVGSAFAAPDGAINKRIRFDFAAFHAEDSMESRGEDRDGLAATTIHLVSAYDATQAQDVEVTVQTLLTAFP